jgi:hypothetical protein
VSAHEKDPQTSERRLDKPIPLALIAAITLQCAGSVSRIATLERRAISDTGRSARLEEQMDPVRLSLRRITQQPESIERALRRREGDR